jgi:hypothetical protein
MDVGTAFCYKMVVEKMQESKETSSFVLGNWLLLFVLR